MSVLHWSKVRSNKTCEKKSTRKNFDVHELRFGPASCVTCSLLTMQGAFFSSADSHSAGEDKHVDAKLGVGGPK
jgi:hypothetical protein